MKAKCSEKSIHLRLNLFCKAPQPSMTATQTAGQKNDNFHRCNNTRRTDKKNCSPGCDANVAPVNHRSSPVKSRSIIQYVRPHTIDKLGVYAQKAAPFKACAPHSHRHRNMPQIQINSLSRVLWLEMVLFMLFLISFVCESVGFIFWPFIINDCCIGQLTDIF